MALLSPPSRSREIGADAGEGGEAARGGGSDQDDELAEVLRTLEDGTRSLVSRPALGRTRTPLCSAVFSRLQLYSRPLVLTRCSESLLHETIFDTVFTQKHNTGTQDAQAQAVEKGETATTVRSQRWVPGRRRRWRLLV